MSKLLIGNSTISFSANNTSMLHFDIDSIKIACCFKISTLGYTPHSKFNNSTCVNIVFFTKFSLQTVSLKTEKSKEYVFFNCHLFFLKSKLILFRTSWTKPFYSANSSITKLINLFKSYLFFLQKNCLGNFVSFLNIDSKISW